MGWCTLNGNLRMRIKFCCYRNACVHVLLAISRTCCNDDVACLLSHIVSCLRKVNQMRQIAVYSNALLVEIWRDVGNHEKPNSEKPLLWLLFVAFEPHYVGHVFSTVGVFCVRSWWCFTYTLPHFMHILPLVKERENEVCSLFVAVGPLCLLIDSRPKRPNCDK